MAGQLPERCQWQLKLQHGVIARRQAAWVGVGPWVIDNLVRRGTWQPLGRGVYAAFSGPPPRLALLWAAVLRLGPHAILSHETAAELDRLLDRPCQLIHVTIGRHQHADPIPGTIIHRSQHVLQKRHPGLSPPRTMIEETVLDLTQAAVTFDEAFGWVSRACQRELTTPTLLRMRLSLRNKLRWRAELSEALPDVGAGVHSTLEFRYLRTVERAHRLPQPRRQVRVIRHGHSQYRDALYDEFSLCIELDGQAAHPAENRWLEIRRDNANAAEGIITLRYGWADIVDQPCLVAAEIAQVLRLRGWRGRLEACRPGCPAVQR